MRFYFLAFFILCIVFILHIAGINGLYVRFMQYDVLVHILGGIGIGCAVYAIIRLHGDTIVHKRLALVLGVLAVGIVWELFEVYFDIASYQLWTAPYYLDTAKDLCDDVIGGALVAWICMRPQYSHESKT